jgi:hypothetical protein
MAARLAAKRRKSQQAADGAHHSWNVLGRNSLQIEIATNGAVGEFGMAERDRTRAEAGLTMIAAPGNQPDEPIREVRKPAPPRATAIRGMAGGAINHFSVLMNWQKAGRAYAKVFSSSSRSRAGRK